MTITLVPYHQDERLPDASFPLPSADVVTITRDFPEGDIWTRLAALYEPVADEVAAQIGAGGVPTVVSGDCLVSHAVLAGVQRAGVDASIVWIDAHGDVHTPETSTSGYLGGMPLRQIVGDHPELLTARLGLRPLPEERALLVDARDLDPAEAAYLATAGIRRASVADAAAPEGPFVLHVDVDVVDRAELPGLRFPVSDGPTAETVTATVRRLLATGRVAALDVACPWHLTQDDGPRRRLLADLLPTP
ncbi:arginase family protein [Actinomadura roseirufa]|uniref:arginase family protein n=1 Tax=Actinomadura roseirufa TaxID=2094049 RepID=UPI001F5F5C52|nr:arginase family protein [Actinomadura roseirufa]